jgi:hypothetical protein
MGQVKAMGSERVFSHISDERAARTLFPTRPDRPLAGEQRRGRGGGWCLVVFLALVWTGCRAWAQSPADPNQLLQQLNEVQVDPSQIYVLRDTQIARDRVKFYFNRGFVVFLSPVAGEVTGAVFVGDGEILLIPPNTVEKQNLVQFTQAAILSEPFSFAYLRFTDQTARELLARARPPEPEDTDQPTGLFEPWNPLIRQWNPDHSVRILQDLLGRRDLPFFRARLQGENLGVFQVIVDERARESVVVGTVRESEQKFYADVWCSFPSRAADARGANAKTTPFRVVSYKIDTRIAADHSLEGHAEVVLESRSAVDRILIFELSHGLKVSEVRDEAGNKLPVFESPAAVASKAAAPGNDWVAVVLPAPRPAGTSFRLNFTYQGNVIAEVGNNLLYVGARGSWYPSRGFSERATYDLTFHFPVPLTLVATGQRLTETTAGGVTDSHWVSDGPIPVAGFNLGLYEVTTRKAENTDIAVYVTGEAEAALEKRHAATQGGQALAVLGSRVGRPPLELLTKPTIPLAPVAGLAEMADRALRAVKYFETLFGPFPYRHVAISQLPASFGQGWPQLVYLPTLSFLRSSERAELGLDEKSEELHYRVMVAHEIAHQWWGNYLGWKSYRDQWLSEGFASYAAALFLAREPDGQRKFHELLRTYKQSLLSKTKEGKTIESGGPIWLGERLSNSLNPRGYQNIVYMKACWVLQMLRLLMTDPARPTEERFFRMLRDFVKAYGGKNASTEDFIRHAEKYLTPALDLEHNHRLDWFFNPWVYGTGIPIYKLTSNVLPRGPHKFLIEGTIEQSGVGEAFEMLVPVVATFARNRKVRLGLVHVTSSGGPFRFVTTSRPIRIAIDDDSILAVVK